MQFVDLHLLAAGARIEHKDLHLEVSGNGGMTEVCPISVYAGHESLATNLRSLPLPIPHFRQVVSMLTNILSVLDEPITHKLFEVCIYVLQTRHSFRSVSRQVKAVKL